MHRAGGGANRAEQRHKNFTEKQILRQGERVRQGKRKKRNISPNSMGKEGGNSESRLISARKSGRLQKKILKREKKDDQKTKKRNIGVSERTKRTK